MNDVTAVAVFVFFAFLVESTTEYIFSPWVDLAKAKWPVVEQLEPLKFIALIVGVLVSFGFELDLIVVAFPDVTPQAPWFGLLLTGLLIGRGGNFVHDTWKTYIAPEQPMT